MVTVKVAADITGLTVKGIRFYEKIGLAAPASRSPSGYRLYSEEDIFRLQQIHFYREQQFSLEEIAELLDNPDVDQRAYYKRKLNEIETKMQELKHIQYTLSNALMCDDCVKSLSWAAQTSMDRSRVAIVGIDLQNDFLDGGSLPCRRIYKIIEPVSRLFQRARCERIPIIYVCDSHHRSDPELEIWQDHAIEGTWGAQVIEDLHPQPQDYLIKKNDFNAFLGTKLQSLLKKLGVDTIILVGWRTHVCVAQTAIEAFHQRYRVFIGEDCVNSPTQMEHEFGLNLLRVNYGIEVLPGEEILDSLKGPGGSQQDTSPAN